MTARTSLVMRPRGHRPRLQGLIIMSKTSIPFVPLLVAVLTCAAQVKNFVPVTDQILLNPSPDDWLMFSRTYDAQRFSPLNQVNKQNASQLALAWSRGLGAGITETIPTVYKGVMYVNVPGGAVQALDATTGDMIWEYQRPAQAPPEGAGGRGRGGVQQGAGSCFS